MKCPAAGLAVLAVLGITTADHGLAQPAREAKPAPADAPKLVSVPLGRRTTIRPTPQGSDKIEDTLSYTVVPYNWQGLYIGLHGGVAWGRTSSENTAPFGGYDAATPLSYSLRGPSVLAGAQAGVIVQRANWVFGAEVDFGYLGLSRVLTVGDDQTSMQYSWYGTFTGRVGFAWDHALYYLKGGGALARIRNTATDLDGGAIDPTDFSSVSGARWGWTIGGGLEYGLAPNMSAKVEYLYMDFGRATSSNLDGDTFQHSNSAHTVKVGVNYRFGGVPLFIKF